MSYEKGPSLRGGWRAALILDTPNLNGFQVDVLEKLQVSYPLEIPVAFICQENLKLALLERITKRILLNFSTRLRFQKSSWLDKTLLVSLFTESSQLLSDFQNQLFDLSQIDVIFSFNDTKVLPEVAKSIKHGILRLEFGDSDSFVDLYGSQPNQHANLYQYKFIKGRWHRKILRSAQFGRYMNSLSLHCDGVLSALVPWFSQTLNSQLLDDTGFKPFFPQRADLFSWKSRLLKQTSALKKSFFEKIRRLFFFQKWHVAIIDKPPSYLIHKDCYYQRKWLPPVNSKKFIADPFPIIHNGELKLIVESFNFFNGKGDIQAISLNSSAGTLPKQVIKLKTHVSYPSMFADGDILYCIPETLGEKEVAIYKCLEFPDKWEKIKVILPNQFFSDPTIFKHEKKWWLFATVYNQFSNGNDQLYAWSSEQLTGDWKEHKQNPIKIDISSARNAGSPFTVNGNLYRPSQDCSTVYGGAVVINQILKLSENEFVETEVNRITPDQHYPAGCHHMASCQNLTFVDGKIEKFSLQAPFVKIISFLRNPNKMPQPRVEVSTNTDSSINIESLQNLDVQTSWSST